MSEGWTCTGRACSSLGDATAFSANVRQSVSPYISSVFIEFLSRGQADETSRQLRLTAAPEVEHQAQSLCSVGAVHAVNCASLVEISDKAFIQQIFDVHLDDRGIVKRQDPCI